MSELFNSILYVPFFNLLVFLYNTVAFSDFGLAIVLLTLIIRAALSPLSVKTFKSQKIMAELQPKVKEIQEKLKNEPQKQSREIMELYQKHNINPFSGCLPLLIQLPILIALYRVSIAGFGENSLSVLYDFVKNPGFLNPTSFGFIDLTKRSILLSLVAGAAQFLQTKMTISSGKNQASQKGNPLGAMNQQMLHFLPLITIIVSMSFPAGLPLYWLATTVFSIFEQAHINKAKIDTHGKSNGKFNLSDR